jgi:hypothetical protein
MDWLFRPIADFFSWSFGLIRLAGMNANILLIVLGAILTTYWLLQMIRHRKNDKGFFVSGK